MPEYPDVELYLSALRPRLLGKRLLAVDRKDPFVLRTVDPPLQALEGLTVTALERLGKRIVFHFEQDLHCIVHLMIAGRFQWKDAGPKRGAPGLLRWQFESGDLTLTEAGSKRRAKVYVVRGEQAVAEHDPGGIAVVGGSLEAFRQKLKDHRHTLKRILTDPRIFSGIGNAYSDEILLHAGLSPVRLSTQLDETETARLFLTAQRLLTDWHHKLEAEWGDKFPSKVTAFHPDMAAHGKYLQPCPICTTPIQRIRYAENETNYCPTCQTGGRLLADRSLSRLLKSDWPKSLDELEEHKAQRGLTP